MRNLKRALSLTLASVMLLGMMIVGSSAKGYDDVAETDNVEAIEVLQAIEVMVGDDRGFGPERPVNRAEMAVVMAKLLSLDYNYYTTSCPFNDVYDWARGYVGAAAANGIVSGRGEGIYDPGSTVTAVEAASMLMRALGYFKYANDTADGFEVSTVRQGTIIGIFDGVGSSATEPMTRNQIAQMVLNALQSAVVEPDGNTINLTTPDGTVLTGKVNYVSVTSAKPFARAIGKTPATSIGSTNDGYIVELGERLYDGDLKLTDHNIDVFGRPSRYWEYKGNAIGTYAKKELMVKSFNVAVKGRDAYDLLGQTAIDDKELLVFVDGAEDETLPANLRIVEGDLRRSNTDDLKSTGRGVVTEFYVDNDYNEITIAIINNYLSQAQTDYNATSEDIRMDTFYNIDNANKNGVGVPYALVYPLTIEAEDYDMIKELKADDLVRVTMAAPDHKYVVDYTGYSIESMNEVEVVADATLTDYSAGNKVYTDIEYMRLSDVTADGTNYKAAEKAFHDEELFFRYSEDVESNLRDATYNLYLDQFGNLLGIEQVEKSDKYIFVVGYDQGSSVLAQAIDQALIIHTDGTMETVRIDDSDLKVWDKTGGLNSKGAWIAVNGGAKKLINTETGDSPAVNAWFTYSVKADGTYKLERMVKNQGVQNRFSITTPGGEEATYIDNMRGTLTSDSYLATPNVLDDYTNYMGTGHDMSGAVAYGNDDSVYITVDVDRTVDTNGSIVKVNSVGTGLRNVSVRPADMSTYTNMRKDDGTAKDTFFIYNDKGFVTYAVVVGTNGAAGYEYIYLDSAIKRTTDDKGDRYLYTFEGIRNKELTTFQSKEPMAYTATASNGKLTKSPAVERTPQAGDLIRAAVGADGIITEMVILPETYSVPDGSANEMYPKLNSDYGYTLKLDRTGKDYDASTPLVNDANPLDLDGENIRSLRTNGNTLWVIGEVTEGNYTLLEPDVVFFVRNPSGSSQHFTVYNNSAGAVNAVNATVNDNRGYISHVATMNTAVTGYAHTVVVDMVYTQTSGGSSTGYNGKAPVDKITGSVIDINLIDVVAASVNDGLIRTRVMNLLQNEGYTLNDLATISLMTGLTGSSGAKANQAMNGLVMAQDRSGTTRYFTVVYHNYWTVTVDSVVRDWVLEGQTTGINMTKQQLSAYAKAGTYYHDGSSYVAYAPSSTDKAITGTISAAKAITTGYIDVAALTDGNVKDKASDENVALYTVSNKNPATSAKKVAANSVLTIEVRPVVDAFRTKNAKVVVSATTTNGAISKEITLTPADIAAGTAKQVTLTTGAVDVTGYTVTFADVNAVVSAPKVKDLPQNLVADQYPTAGTTDEKNDWKARVIAAVKALSNPDGIYKMTDELKTALGDVGSSDCAVILYTYPTGAGTNTDDIYMVIRDANGTIVSAYGLPAGANGSRHILYFPMNDLSINSEPTYSGSLTHDAVYSYSFYAKDTDWDTTKAAIVGETATQLAGGGTFTCSRAS